MKFLKVFLAALLAVIAGGVLSFLFWVVLLIGMAGASPSTTEATITSETIVKIDLAENIIDAPSRNPLSGFDYTTMTMSSSLNLLKVLQAIESAAIDGRVKGIYLNFTGLGSVETAALEEIRAALIQFKESGKFILAYNEAYSQGSYYLASVADKIYLQPEGGFMLTGMASTGLFMKGALDKLGVKAEVFRPSTCTYKSAVEPYIRKEMSPENRAQTQEMLNDMWGVLVKDIAESRNLTPEKIQRLANNLEVVLPEDALKHGLVDALVYESDMDKIFADFGVKADKEGEYNIISLGEYIALNPSFAKFGSPAVGIIYANGEVRDGEGEDDNIYSANLAALLKKARKDENIKAVVFRVNSPGGSALASDVIWKEVELLRAEKPVIVSMGNYAASGGYYISAGADAILADKLTLTGSIGVFGIMLEGEGLLNNTLGITTDVVKTGASADFGNTIFGLGTRKISSLERAAMLRSVDRVYEVFTQKVASGRNLPIEKVLDIAQGRVWSGTRAVDLGLVDANGGLREAISLAATKANIAENFRIEEVIEELDPVSAFIQQLSTSAASVFVGEKERKAIELYNSIEKVFAREGVQAYCPYSVVLE